MSDKLEHDCRYKVTIYDGILEVDKTSLKQEIIFMKIDQIQSIEISKNDSQWKIGISTDRAYCSMNYKTQEQVMGLCNDLLTLMKDKKP